MLGEVDVADSDQAQVFASKTREWVSALRWLGIGIGSLVAVTGGTGNSLPIGIAVATTSYVAYVICTSLLWLVELTAGTGAQVLDGSAADRENVGA